MREVRWAVCALVVAAPVVGGFLYEHRVFRDSVRVDACKTILENRLKAPSTVQYADVRQRGSGGNEVYISYDAENGFGAMIRGTFTCEFYVSDDGFLRLNTLSRDGEQLTDLEVTMANSEYGLKRVQ